MSTTEPKMPSEDESPGEPAFDDAVTQRLDDPEDSAATRVVEPPPFVDPGEGTRISMSRRIGRYEVERELGGGAMGRVYLARDPMIDRKVALKTFRSTEEGTDLRARLVDEARKAAAISHPNVVTIYDVIEEGDAIFIAMEYIEGSSLEEQLREGPLDLHDAVEMISQVASALDHLHLRGVVHRDLKPANILVTGDGTVKLADFGIAAAAEARRDDGSEDVYGTPRYMAPEQIRGEVVDQRTDVFALGVLLVEMTTGATPFPGGTVTEILRAILQQEPRIPTLDAPGDVPHRWNRVVRKALSRRPERRYPSAGALARDLWRATREPERGGGGVRIGARGLILGLGTLIVIVFGIWTFFGEGRKNGSSTVQARSAGDFEVYLPLIKEGRRLMEAGDPRGAVVLLTAATRLAPEPALVESLLEEARQMAEEQGVELLLADAKSALAEKRYDEVLDTASSLLASSAGHDEALEVLAQVDAALEQERRALEKQRRAVGASDSATTKAEDGETEAVAVEALLTVRVRSDAPKGSIQIYAGQERIFDERFNFYERRWLVRRIARGGVLEGQVDVPPGTWPLRVVVVRAREKALVTQLDGVFVAGEEQELEIDVPREGDARVILR